MFDKHMALVACENDASSSLRICEKLLQCDAAVSIRVYDVVVFHLQFPGAPIAFMSSQELNHCNAAIAVCANPGMILFYVLSGRGFQRGRKTADLIGHFF